MISLAENVVLSHAFLAGAGYLTTLKGILPTRDRVALAHFQGTYKAYARALPDRSLSETATMDIMQAEARLEEAATLWGDLLEASDDGRPANLQWAANRLDRILLGIDRLTAAIPPNVHLSAAETIAWERTAPFPTPGVFRNDFDFFLQHRRSSGNLSQMNLLDIVALALEETRVRLFWLEQTYSVVANEIGEHSRAIASGRVVSLPGSSHAWNNVMYRKKHRRSLYLVKANYNNFKEELLRLKFFLEKELDSSDIVATLLRRDLLHDLALVDPIYRDLRERLESLARGTLPSTTTPWQSLVAQRRVGIARR